MLPTGTGQVRPIDLYELIVTDEVIDFIAEETDTFAEQIIASTTMTRKSRLIVRRPTDRAEMKKFLGVVILMGIIH